MANDSILIQVQLGSPTRANINAVTRQIQSALSNVSANVQISNGRQAAQQLQTIKNKTDSATKSMNSFGEAIGLSGRRFLAFTSAVAVVGRLTSALSQATREAIKFEREFVKLAQVFDTDVKSLGRLQNSMSELAQEFGLSATVIAKTSVVLAQSGLNARQTEQAMRTLAKTTLASTFENIASTTEGAVAIMAQFGTQASLLESQLGAINAVSKKFAVESGDIIEAVRRAGGAFRAAGGNFEDFIALFTAVRSTTRESAETIATGFRTIFARIQRPRTIEFFRELNIELTNGRGNFIGAFQAIRRLSDGLQRAGIEAGSLKFASVVEQLGGIRQVSRVIPLLGEFAKAERARQVAQQGAASLDADVAKAQETLAQAFARTTENFRALIREISQTESFQSIVRIALSLANAFIEVARTLKPLIPLIAAFGAIKIGGLASGALKKGFGGAGGTGGLGQGFNKGGFVPGTGNSDTVPAMLTPGEFVIRKSAVQAFGAENLAGINKYARGGVTTKEPITATGKQISTVYPSLNNKVVVDETYSANVIKHMLPSSTGKKGIPTVTAKVINAMKTETGLMWQRFEKAIPKVIKTGPNAGGNAALDYRRDPGDAKFLTYGSVYKGQDEPGSGSGKGNNAITMLAKLLSDQGVDTKTKNVNVYYPQNPKQIAAIVKKGKTPISTSGQQRKKKAAGGSISGTDTVPALLTPGEFVINKKSAESFGYGNLRKINKYNKGGVVGVQKFQSGGQVLSGAAAGAIGLSVVIESLSDELKSLTSALSTFAATIFITSTINSKVSQKTKSIGDKLTKANEKKLRVENRIIKRGERLQKELEEVSKEVDDFLKDQTKYNSLTREQKDSAIAKKARLTKQKEANDEKLGRAQKRFSFGGVSKQLLNFENAAKVATVAITVFSAGLAAYFTFLSKSAQEASKQAIKFGDSATAGSEAARSEQLKSASQAAIAIGVFSGALVTAGAAAAGLSLIAVPAAAVAAKFLLIAGVLSAIVGFAGLIIDSQKAIQSFSNVLFSVSKFLLNLLPITGELRKSILGSLPDPALNAELASRSASFAAELVNAESSLKSFNTVTTELQDEFELASGNLERQSQLLENQINKIGDINRKSAIGQRLGSGASQSDVIKNLKVELENLQKETLKEPTQENLRAEKLLEQRLTQEEEILSAVEDRAKAELSLTTQVFKNARTLGQFQQTLLDINDGQQVLFDQSNIITRESISETGKLNKQYQLLLLSGKSELQARIELTKAIYGEKSAVEQLNKSLLSTAELVGSEFRDLLIGSAEEQAKAAQKINTAFSVIQDPSRFQQLGSEQKKGTLDFIATLSKAGVSQVKGVEILDVAEQLFKESLAAQGGQAAVAEFEAFSPEVQKKIIQGFTGIDVTAQEQLQVLRDIAQTNATIAAKAEAEQPQQDPNATNDQRQKDINQAKARAEQEAARIVDEIKTSAKTIEDSQEENNTAFGELGKKIERLIESIDNLTKVFNKPLQSAAKAIGSGGFKPARPLGPSQFYQSKGGPIYAAGGTLVNFKPKGTDTVPAMLTPGEFVIRKSAVDEYGTNFMEDINNGEYPVYRQDGGAAYEDRRISGRFGRTKRLKPSNSQTITIDINDPFEKNTPKSNSIDDFISSLNELNEISSRLPSNLDKLNGAVSELEELAAQPSEITEANGFSRSFVEFNEILNEVSKKRASFISDDPRSGREQQVSTARKLLERNRRARGLDSKIESDRNKIFAQDDKNIEARILSQDSEFRKFTSRSDEDTRFNRRQRRGVVDELAPGLRKPLRKAPTSIREDREAERKARLADRVAFNVRNYTGGVKGREGFEEAVAGGFGYAFRPKVEYRAITKQENKRAITKQENKDAFNKRFNEFRKANPKLSESRARKAFGRQRNKEIQAAKAEKTFNDITSSLPSIDTITETVSSLASPGSTSQSIVSGISPLAGEILKRTSSGVLAQRIPSSPPPPPLPENATSSVRNVSQPGQKPDGPRLPNPQVQRIAANPDELPEIPSALNLSTPRRTNVAATNPNQPTTPAIPEGLSSSLDLFGSAANKLADVLQNHTIPEIIKLEFGSPTVNVNLNGAEVLKTVNEGMAKLMKSEIGRAINDYHLANSNGSFTPYVDTSTNDTLVRP